MAKGDDIEIRLVGLAVRVVKLSDNLPNNRSANHIAGQLLRSGTSPAAHYAEARGAESPKDFQHKLKICSKELNESRVMTSLFKECDELCRIINASIKTSRKNQPG